MSYSWNDRHKPREHLRAVPSAPIAVDGGHGDTTYGLKALESEASAVAATPPGQRNDALNRAWFRMGRLVAGGQLTGDTARSTLALAGAQAGLDQREIDTVLRTDETSALAASAPAPRQPQPIDAPGVTVLEEKGKPDEPPPETTLAEVTPVRERFPIIDWYELWADDTEDEWIVEPLLPARRLVALYSAPKVGKSLLMLEIAVAIAQRAPILGVLPEREHRVLYVDFENDPRGDVRERLQAMGQEPNRLQNLCYLSYPSMAKLDTLAGAADLMAAVHEYECEVVVIDTISRAVGGEENENDTWLNFYRNTGLALKQAGIACIRLDHTGKDAEKGMRGGSAKYGDVDAVWRLSRVTEEVYSLDCTDNRMPISEKSLTLHRHAGPLRHVVDGGGPKAKLDAKVEAIIEALDAAGAEKDIPTRDAEALAREAGVGARRSVLIDAVKRRRQRMGVYLIDEEE